MSDEEETGESVAKASKRDRFKGALSRTKTKFKRKEIPDGDADYKPVHGDEDVADFLARGRNSTSTGRPSISGSYASGRPSTSDSLAFHTSPESIVKDPFTQSQPPTKKLFVPKIDVSTSQRWPGAKPFEVQNQGSNGLLKPEYQARSQSVSSLSKGRGRARGMSVTFTTKPPIVIGEGGDEAQTPPIEISRIKARARSASPVPTLRATEPDIRPWGSRSPARRKPLPGVPCDPRSPMNDGPSLGLRRIQTGTIPSAAPNESKMALEKEFELSLGLGSASTNSAASDLGPTGSPQIVAPRPMRPPAPYPSVKNMPEAHDLKSTPGTVNLRGKFEGNHRRQQSQDHTQSAPGQPPRFYEQPEQPQQDRHPAPESLEKRHDATRERLSPEAKDCSPQAKPLTGNWL